MEIGGYDLMGTLSLLTIPILLGIVVYLIFDRALKKAIIVGLLVLLVMMLLGITLHTIVGWFGL